MPRGFTTVAIIAAHNEADIIGPVVGHLIEQGLSVYLLDHASTDGTTDAVAPFLGHGLLAIEPFPGDRFPAARSAFAWADILTRKAELSGELDADWFIHHDADEFRESPWEHLSLLDAIRRVDRFGYNAIDFEVFDFQPTDDSLQPGADPRPALRFYEPGRAWDKVQIKCWKKGIAPPDLISSGGHDAMFPGRRVFPMRFLLRHYPFRGQAHGTQKVFVDRRPRLLPQETSRGWHVQYGELSEDHNFVRPQDTLLEYDAEAARLDLMLRNREAEDRQAALQRASETVAEDEAVIAGQSAKIAAHEATILAREKTIAAHETTIATRETTIVARDARIQGLESELAGLRAVVQRLEAELACTRTLTEQRGEQLRERSAAVDALAADLASMQQLVDRLLGDIDAQRRDLAKLYASRSWRWTKPLRAIFRALTGR
jgi:hypothetical protein